MISILRWLLRGTDARPRSRELRGALERIVAAREAHLEALETAIARTREQLGIAVPEGPDGGLVYQARMRLVTLRADVTWVRELQRAEFEVAVARSHGLRAAADESLGALADRVASVEAMVAQEVAALGAVLEADGVAISNAAALEHIERATIANMVLFAPGLALDIIGAHADMKSAHDDAMGRAVAVLERRQGHMRLCSKLPHRRRLSGRAQAHVDSAAIPVDGGSVVALGDAHRAVCVAMTEIHAEQFGSRRR